MMPSFLPSTLPQIVVERMLNGVLEGFVLAALAWFLLLAVGRRSSSTRFAVWFVVLITVGALPWMESLHRSSGVPGGSSQSAILIPESWSYGMFFAWAVVALVLLARVVAGLWQIRRLRLTSHRVDLADLDPVLRSAFQGVCQRAISLHVSQSVRVPMATGFLRPMIVIPEWVLRDLSVEELKVVLLHEAAHLQRWDDWTNLAQKVLRAVFFFHPLVWWLESKLALEREMACDDFVVAATSSPRAYAACLVTLAEKSLGRRNLALAQAAVNRVRHTTLRIRQILEGKRSGGTAVWKPAVACATTAAMACLVFVNETPKLVGFTSPIPHSQASTSVSARAFTNFNESNLFVKRAAYSINSGKLSPRQPSTTKLKVKKCPFVTPQWTAKDAGIVTARPPHSEESARALPVADRDSAPTYQRVAFTAEQTVFVVMQDQQLTAAGDKLVRFNVYRLTVFYPEFYPSNPQKTLSKSI
jgi:Zn-dependent protease with chaperone function